MQGAIQAKRLRKVNAGELTGDLRLLDTPTLVEAHRKERLPIADRAANGSLPGESVLVAERDFSTRRGIKCLRGTLGRRDPSPVALQSAQSALETVARRTMAGITGGPVGAAACQLIRKRNARRELRRCRDHRSRLDQKKKSDKLHETSRRSKPRDCS